MEQNNTMHDFQDMLKVYYARLFPIELYYNWLSYGDEDNFRRREFSFTLDRDVWVRYQSFTNQSHFAKELLRVVPHKIDIGAIFNIFPSNNQNSTKLVALERELVFDIDLTDYDDVRTCCSGSDICCKCWEYMKIAVKILDLGLREDFGFKNILWVFSGRRGIHAWVCDPEARILDKSQRTAVGEYFQIVTGNEFTGRKVILHKIHHSVERALNIIKPIFSSLCMDQQDVLGDDERIEKFLKVLPNPESISEVKTLFSQQTSSAAKWEAFVDYANHQIRSNKKWRNHRNIVDEIMLQYCYPRLDINVTKGLNHLLKSPFSVHPKTGKISIPFHPKAVDKFDPINAPNIHMVMKEIDAFDEKLKATEGDAYNKKIKDFKKTSLNKSIRILQEFLQNLEELRKVSDKKDPISF